MEAQITLNVRVEDVPAHVDALLRLQSRELRLLANDLTSVIWEDESGESIQTTEDIQTAVENLQDIRSDIAEVSRHLAQLTNILSGCVTTTDDTAEEDTSHALSEEEAVRLTTAVKVLREQAEEMSGFNSFLRKVNLEHAQAELEDNSSESEE